VWWFVARSSGIIAWALLTLSVCWGLLLSTRLLSRRVSPAWLLDLHRHLGGLAVVFTGIHLVGLVADSYVTFGWAEIFIPMASSWKPGAVAFGVVAFYLLLAIEATSLAMRRLPRSLWRWVHRSSFVLFGFATYHGIAAGTDAGNAWYRIATWTSIGIVVALTLVLVVVAVRTRTRLASFPPIVVRTGVADVPDDSTSLPPPALVPSAALIAAPSVPLTVESAVSVPPTSSLSAPLAPAAHVAAPREAESPVSTLPNGSIAPLGSIEPFALEARVGPVPPPPRPSTPRVVPAPSVAPPPTSAARPDVEPPVSPWLPPGGAPMTPTADRELVTAGQVGEDAGGPPTTAT